MEANKNGELLVVFAVSTAFGFSQAVSVPILVVLLGLLFSISLVYMVLSLEGSPTPFMAAAIGLAPAVGFGGLEGGVLFAATGAGGALLGLGIRRELAVFSIIILGAVPALVLLFVVSVSGGYAVRHELYRQQIESTLDRSTGETEDAGQNNRSARAQEEFVERITGVYLKMIPAFETLSAVVNSFITYLLAVVALARFGCRIKAPPPFAVWRLPEFLIYPFILGLLMLIVGRDGLRVLGLNLVAAISIGYLVTGLAIIRHFFQKRAVPALIQGLSFFMLFLMQPFGTLLAWGLGLFDIRFNFRRL
ncbi:DUF2232 domain-containing protein [candidate division KSB1 bacterium]